MLHELKGKKVEVVLGAFDAVDGEVVDMDDSWLKLQKKNKLVFVKIDNIRRIMANNR